MSNDQEHVSDPGRRDFLKGALAAGSVAAALSAAGAPLASAQALQPGMVPGTKNHYSTCRPATRQCTGGTLASR